MGITDIEAIYDSVPFSKWFDIWKCSLSVMVQILKQLPPSERYSEDQARGVFLSLYDVALYGDDGQVNYGKLYDIIDYKANDLIKESVLLSQKDVLSKNYTDDVIRGFYNDEVSYRQFPDNHQEIREYINVIAALRALDRCTDAVRKASAKQPEEPAANSKIPGGFVGFCLEKIEAMPTEERERFLSVNRGDSSFFDYRNAWNKEWSDKGNTPYKKPQEGISKAKNIYRELHKELKN